MKPLAIAILEDDPRRIAAMKDWLEDRLPMYEHVFHHAADQMIDWLSANLNRVLAVSLDHDLEPTYQPNPGTGRLVADYLTMKSARFPIVIHSTNRHAVAGMRQALEDNGWKCTIVSPYEDLLWIRESWWPALRQQILDQAALQEPRRASA
jgi:hypothetical protein